MPNKIIINFGKNKLTAEVIDKTTHEVTTNSKSDIFAQLQSLAHNKKAKLDMEFEYTLCLNDTPSQIKLFKNILEEMQ